MKLSIKLTLAVLMALLVYVAFGGHLINFGGIPHAGSIVTGLYAAAALLAGTVTYKYPVSGATAPTAVQIAQLSTLTAQVELADGAASQLITHNWGLSTAEQADLFPLVNFYTVTPGTAQPNIRFSFPDGNSVLLTKDTTAGTGMTVNVILLRPHTNSR